MLFRKEFEMKERSGRCGSDFDLLQIEKEIRYLRWNRFFVYMSPVGIYNRALQPAFHTYLWG